LSLHPCYVCSDFPCTPAGKKTQDDHSRKILLLTFDGFIPEVDYTKAVDNINAILATFSSGIRVQVMTSMY
jgi:hypothetical protein